MGEIKVLSRHLVNKIAAGEVIERPASVVKELLENAIDAGAGQIDVSVAKGGKEAIVVTDDGVGMSEADVGLAFLPHATSKLDGEEDLFRIGTMGFRGEALASIASISHASIRTRRRGEDAGCEIAASGAEVGPVRPCPAAPGTTVAVRDLFFNTPARRKFLKADMTEFGHVSEAVTRIAVAHRGVGFALTHNGRSVRNAPATDSLSQRVADLFGGDFAEGLLVIPAEADEVGVTGLIGPPAAGRPSGRWQYFFLNGRYIRDRTLGHALREAYRGLIDPNRQPVALIFLDVPPDAVDVNVHPTKVEVRFRDSQSVHSHVLAALRRTLQKAEIRPPVRLPGDGPGEEAEEGDDDRRRGLRAALAEFFKNQPPPQPPLEFPGRGSRAGAASAPRAPGAPGAIQPAPGGTWQAEPAAPTAEPTAPLGEPAALTSDVAAPTAVAAAPLSAMQVHNSYLIVADADGIVIVDQHALHERILYDQLLARITEGPLESQRQLLPATLPVTGAQRGLLAEHAELLDRLGIEVSDFGPDTVAVQRFPSFLDRQDPAAFLAEMLDRLAAEDPGLGREQLLADLLETMACQAAVKAGDPLTPAEIDALLAQRDRVAKSTACPHGRPTQIRLSLAELAKQFKRT